METAVTFNHNESYAVPPLPSPSLVSRTPRFMASMAPKSDLSRVLQKIGELNLKQGTSAFSKFGCKNEG